MPITSPITPAQFKELIPSAAGSLCGKITNLLRVFPERFYTWFAFVYKENGEFTDDFKTMLCELECSGNSDCVDCPAENALPSPTGVQASDGSYADKIRVTWNAVVAPTGVSAVIQYQIYRSLATNTAATSAVLVGTVAAPTLVYDDPVDEDLVTGTTYNYWVRAYNGVLTSAYGGYDTGNAGSVGGDIDAPASVSASTALSNDYVWVTFEPIAGATGYAIYRATDAGFSDITQLNVDDETPLRYEETTLDKYLYTNFDQILYYDLTAVAGTVYYYKVKAKRSSPPAESVFSPAVTGLKGYKPTHTSPTVLANYTPANGDIALGGKSYIWIGMFGGGGGGAGGSSYGGGGGGGGAVLWCEVEAAVGATYRLEYGAGTSDVNAAGATDGDDAKSVQLIETIAAVDTIIAEAFGGFGGEAGVTAGGLGGNGGSGVFPGPGTITDSGGISGTPGKPGTVSRGGYAGYAWGAVGSAPACNNFGGCGALFTGNAGGLARAGAGCDPQNPLFPSGARGGFGKSGYAYIVVHN